MLVLIGSDNSSLLVILLKTILKGGGISKANNISVRSFVQVRDVMMSTDGLDRRGCKDTVFVKNITMILESASPVAVVM